jgi:hypothetical protein
LSDADELPRDAYLNPKEAARRIGMDCAFLRNLVARGEGPAVARLHSGAWVVREEALLAWARAWMLRMAAGLPAEKTVPREPMTAARKPPMAGRLGAAPHS